MRGMVLGSEGVMKPVRGPGRPRAYKTRDGKRVPSVTTIIGRWKDATGLMNWAWREGMEGRDYRDTRDDAADAGTLAHEMIDAQVHGLDPTQQLRVMTASDETRKTADELFGRFLDWSMDVGLQVTHTELPLVSDAHRTGGTLDAVGAVNGVASMLDWKKGSRVYVDYLLQLATYRFLWNECQVCTKHGRPAYVDQAVVLLLGDSEGGTRPVVFDAGQLDQAFEQFVRLRAAYDADAELRKMVGK